jgi:hypothetical protein
VAGAALAGTIIGGLITFFTRSAERKAEAEAARRARVAEFIGRVRTFLTTSTGPHRDEREPRDDA